MQASALRHGKHIARAAATCASTSARRAASSSSTASSASRPIKSVLIANRGEIALRVGRTAAQHGIRTTTLYTDPDASSQHALSSPFAVNLGATSAYLDGDRIIAVARQHGCDAIHPGYGFLSENPKFAKGCTDAGLVFIGPPSEAIEAMGNKSRSKEIMTAAGVPCIPGYHGPNQDPNHLFSEAQKIGFPVLLKAVSGGGGKGMRISTSTEDFYDQLSSAKSEAMSSFSDDRMLVEKYITTPRHIEVQVFADKHGNCVALGERDCSLQRRHQKIIEESPAPNLEDTVRKDLWEKAKAAALAVGYEGAGTVEFIFDNETREFFFMEMNTRLQVEHPVTEMVTGQDLVHWQFCIAEGLALPLNQHEIEQEIANRGHAFEARIYAENPQMDFIPDSGRLSHLQTPPVSEDVRVDAGFIEDDEVSSFYDPMISKLIVRGSTRREALQKLKVALEDYEVAGPVTNIEFLKTICESPDFMAGEVETGYIPKHRDDLFSQKPIANEVWAQAALATILQEAVERSNGSPLLPRGSLAGFGGGYQSRNLSLSKVVPPNTGASASENIQVHQTGPDSYNVLVGGQAFQDIRCHLISPKKIRSFFGHTRVETTVVREEDSITLFQQGAQYRLKHTTPKWTEKALGLKDVANSVLAPMPCKILRVNVNEGDEVKKEQGLVVIESMKMETVIRSPQNGKISKVIHKEGDMCKAGTALVEFEVSNV